MPMKRSIRLTLLGWYALILTAVIGALGGVLVTQQRDAAMDSIDGQLDALAASVATAVEWEEEDWYEFEPRETFAAEIAGVAAIASEMPYYVVWDGEGEVLGLYGSLPEDWRRLERAETDDAVRKDNDNDENDDDDGDGNGDGDGDGEHEHEEEDGAGRERTALDEHRHDRRRAHRDDLEGGDDDREGRDVWELLTDKRPERLGARTRGAGDGQWREVVVAGPRGSRVLVGVDTSAVRARIESGVMTTSGACLLALLVALAGGWFLVSRVLRPIERITQTAAGISEHNLSERIDVAHTESELGRLAATLNGTFEQLERAFVRQVRFTADASHELRTPLSVVIAHGELALRKDRRPEEYRDALAVMLRSARRMSDLVERLLMLSRGDADSSIAREPVALDRVLGDIARDLGPLAGERDIKLATDLEPVTVIGESGLLTAALTNIVSNAVRYNRDGGRIDVLLKRRDGLAVVTISDTGAGIPAEAQAAVFERFYRVDTARSRAAGGSGLGLAIARQIIDGHAGTIALQSVVGSGTTVTIELPCTA